MIRVKNPAENSTFIKTKIRASGPTTTWQIEGVNVETVISLIFFGFKITRNDDCSYQSKCHLLLDVKAMTNLDIALKRRHITLLNCQ